MTEAEIFRIQTNLQIATALFAIFFLLIYALFYRQPRPHRKDTHRPESTTA